MAITVTRDGTSTIVQLDDSTLDSDGASRLRKILRAVLGDASGGPVIVDVSRAREVTPIALASLVDDFEELRAVRFRGLSQHASRLLGYLTRTSFTASSGS